MSQRAEVADRYAPVRLIVNQRLGFVMRYGSDGPIGAVGGSGVRPSTTIRPFAPARFFFFSFTMLAFMVLLSWQRFQVSAPARETGSVGLVSRCFTAPTPLKRWAPRWWALPCGNSCQVVAGTKVLDGLELLRESETRRGTYRFPVERDHDHGRCG